MNRANAGGLVPQPSGVDFGAVFIGLTASTTVSLVNESSAPVAVTQLNLTGQSFSVVGATKLPVTIAAGGTYTLNLQFNPAAAGTATGQLIVASNSSTSGTPVISLSGTGTTGTGSAALSALSCSSGAITGLGTDTCTVTLTTSAPSGGLIVNLSSSSSAVMVPSTVAVPADAVSAGFTATVSPVATAQAVTMTASAGSVLKSFALQLNAAMLALSISATNVAFGDVVVNTSATQPVTLTSTGILPVTVNGATLTGAGFTLPGAAFPATLSPGQQAILNIEFDPTALGVTSGQLTVASNSSTNGSAPISLSGTGTAAQVVAVAVTPSSVATPAEATEQFAASVTGTSNTAVTWTASGTGCSGATCGTISSSGLYNAPTAVPSPSTVTITATSVSDPSKSASAAVRIVPKQPFLSTSPWNTPVASLPGVSYSSIGTAISSSVSNPSISPWSKAGWVAIYSAKTTDPIVQVYYSPHAWTNIAKGTWFNSGNSPAVEANITAEASTVWPAPWNNYSTTDVTGNTLVAPANYHSQQSYYWTPTPNVPASAVPAPGADGHLAVFQPNGWVLETFATIRLSNGNIVCGYAGYTWPQTNGSGFQSGRRATMIPNYAGVIRNGELASGVIPHALALDLPQSAVKRQIRWPAYAVDTTNNYSGTLIPFGALLVIPPGITNADLGITTPLGTAIANALRTYGAYVVDSTDPGLSIFDTEVASTDLPSWSGPAEADLRSIMNALELATFTPGTDSLPTSQTSKDSIGPSASYH